MLLDTRNLAVIAALVSVLLAVAVQAQSWRVSSENGLPDRMAMALLCHGVGLGLFAQRGILPVFWTVAVANVLILSAFSLFYLAIEKLRGEQPMILVAALPPAMIAIMFPTIGFSDAMTAERVVVFTVVSFAAYAIVTVSALGIMQKGCRRGPLLITIAMMLNLAVQGARALRTVDQPSGSLFSNDTPQLLYYATVVVAIVLASCGYIAMVRDASKRFEEQASPHV